MLKFLDYLREEVYSKGKKSKDVYDYSDTQVPTTEDFDKDPQIGWWRHGKHMTVYHGTHDDNVPHIMKHGLNHKDPTSGMISTTHDPHTAHGYAAMSSSGGEHHFRKAGGSPKNTPHEQRSVIKMKIPMKWAEKHRDEHLRGNLNDTKTRMSDENRYKEHKEKGGRDHEYYQTSEVRFKRPIPPKYIVGVHKKSV